MRQLGNPRQRIGAGEHRAHRRLHLQQLRHHEPRVGLVEGGQRDDGGLGVNLDHVIPQT